MSVRRSARQVADSVKEESVAGGASEREVELDVGFGVHGRVGRRLLHPLHRAPQVFDVLRGCALGRHAGEAQREELTGFDQFLDILPAHRDAVALE